MSSTERTAGMADTAQAVSATQPASAAQPAPVDLLFAGDVFCDLIFSNVAMPEPGAEVFADAFTITPGGTANRAVAAARLGARTALLSELGFDPLGSHLASILAAEADLDLRWLRRTAGYQTPVSAALTGEHERSFVTYQEPGLPLVWADDAVRVGATHVNAAAELPSWVPGLRAAGTTVVGGVGWDATGEWSAATLARLDGLDVFIPNDLEAMRYTRTEDAVAAARALGEHVEQVVVTRGRDGAVAFNAGTGELVEVPAVIVAAVDPTGAGDVFTASFMASERFGWDQRTRLQFGCLCASLSVRRLGGAASAPRAVDVADYLAEHRPAGDWAAIAAWAASAAAPAPA